ncbi:Cytochrome P450 monooxygenase [Psilocybe cubensis]|uniref:Cytochrome P450 monooxygenase n=1 Tax=Psilocybe cubensis TaxID=181762 RepID=A0ACB8GNW9_PSICU|nr:Cytochrome P450 monooxygenase [Psilocybe cubensis]KAH9477256.1 Cytochrome P450 monooxygenase [Psilocybe cubensis]
MLLKQIQFKLDDTHGDSAHLPLVHRLRSGVPLAIPHAAVDDCQYREYTIPKGAPILMNIWGIFHDPDLFERPDEFWPERYLLTPDGTNPGHKKSYTIRLTLPFGSGKRICPGIHLANTNVNVAVMRLIWAFGFSRVDRPATRTTEWNISDEYDDGISLTPKPFK